jgi:ketosteroid isomerase-like protein
MTIAEQVRTALAGGDLEAFAHLLDPDVTWGAPGDASPPCRNRKQVLEWYRRGRSNGRRALDVDVTVHGDKLLVAMTVTDADGEAAPRWQVLTVRDDRVVDIRGYDDADAARAALR